MKTKLNVFIHKIYLFVNEHALLFETIHLALWIINQLYDCTITNVLESVLDGILW
jgi:hypothetical protein